MENTILTQAKKLFPKGTVYYSATNNLKTPMKVHSLRMAENYKNTVVDSEGGCIYTNGTWARKI